MSIGDEEPGGRWTSLIVPVRLSRSIMKQMGTDYRKIITMEADKMGGKPCVRGLRITVSDVLDYLASGMTEAEILADFPDPIVRGHPRLPGVCR